ncbi:anti-sigma factor antagonist [Streptomyces pluripotens]|uniref:Anti-sigma factor antagonist n=1 Tax=Streptomyces pluripotens TaxID=1355015 RepID=A0A221NS73_9ACTN|nr:MULTISPECIES: STAS domain-containing protein [Streptomyces]ASN22794.1 anti-sigma factor antagonist [Streptomyces pluripotens]
MRLHTVCTVHPDHILVSLYGEADMLTAPLLHQALVAALTHAEHRDVVADLCGIDFIDSTGAQPLIAADQTLHPQRRRLWLACLHTRTARLLHGIRLTDYFPVLPVTIPLPRCQPVGSGPVPRAGKSEGAYVDRPASGQLRSRAAAGTDNG